MAAPHIIRVDPDVYAALDQLRHEVGRQRGTRASFNDAARVLVLGELILHHQVTIAHEGHGRFSASCSACDWALEPDNGPFIYRLAREHDSDGLQRRQILDVNDNQLRL